MLGEKSWDGHWNYGAELGASINHSAHSWSLLRWNPLCEQCVGARNLTKQNNCRGNNILQKSTWDLQLVPRQVLEWISRESAIRRPTFKEKIGVVKMYIVVHHLLITHLRWDGHEKSENWVDKHPPAQKAQAAILLSKYTERNLQEWETCQL